MDKRMSPTISWGEAKKFHLKRKPKAKKMDRNIQHKKQQKQPTKAWKKSPGRSDVKGIDSRRRKK